MDEETRARREIIFKVLGWGGVVYLLVTGFALNQHSLFELNPPERNEQLYETQISHADALDRQSNALRETDPVGAAKLRVDAAKIRVEVGEARKDQSDSWYRAAGLIVAVVIYSVAYPLIVWLVYTRTDSGGTLTESDPIPLRLALVYAIAMGLLTSVAALTTAYQ